MKAAQEAEGSQVKSEVIGFCLKNGGLVAGKEEFSNKHKRKLKKVINLNSQHMLLLEIKMDLLELATEKVKKLFLRGKKLLEMLN